MLLKESTEMGMKISECELGELVSTKELTLLAA
jgi:hypothetical protein